MYKSYEMNRTPFGVYQHPYWLQDYPFILEGFIQFLDYLSSTIDSVYFVSVSKVQYFTKYDNSIHIEFTYGALINF